MRPLLSLAALPLALAACVSEDAAPPVVADPTPEAVVADSAAADDGPFAGPIGPSTPAPAVAGAPPTVPPAVTPVAPALPVGAPPAAEPEATHTTEGGRAMDGHSMDDGMPMDHSQTNHADDGGQ